MELKIEVLFYVYDKEFNKRIEKHYTTVDRLCDGRDDFKYNEVDIIAKRLFTGLKDKNGVEIYQGDIVKAAVNKHYWLSVVSNCDGLGGNNLYGIEFCNNVTTDEWEGVYTYKLQKSNRRNSINNTMEVIGNIYENPELLEV